MWQTCAVSSGGFLSFVFFYSLYPSPGASKFPALWASEGTTYQIPTQLYFLLAQRLSR